MDACDNTSVKKGGSWTAAVARLLQYFRAAKVDPDAPYLVEEEYFWQLITLDDLPLLMDKTVALCFPQPGDHMAHDAYLLSARDEFEPQLNALPIMRHELGSPPMVYRGKTAKNIFTRFSRTITRDSAKYTASKLSASETRQAADMHALVSHKFHRRYA